jgi:hypothetical protein
MCKIIGKNGKLVVENEWGKPAVLVMELWEYSFAKDVKERQN